MLKLFNDKVLKSMQTPAVSSRAASGAPRGDRKSGDPAKPSDPRSAPAPAGSSREALPPPPPSSSSSFGKNYPIIILPGSLTTCITLYNVRDFLLQGMYVSVEEKRSAGAQKERDTLLLRDLPNGGRLIYRVIDDPTKLTEAEWGMVVAVFATGQLWQFKNWRYPTPVELFQRVMGVHVCVDSAAVDANILSWNCRVLKVRRIIYSLYRCLCIYFSWGFTTQWS